MKKIIVSLVIFLVAAEGFGWWVYQNSKKESQATPSAPIQIATPAQKTEPTKASAENNSSSNNSASDSTISGGDNSSFPPPTVEIVNGITQRTIHMGVRQWAWDPSQLSVNYGEKVILIMHNADVQHSISIPDLNVRQVIPEEGAIVMFIASKRGTFDFFCDTPCGSGHSQMRGKITVS